MASEGFTDKRKTLLFLLAAMAGGLLNSLLEMASAAIGTPLFMDSIFTAACGLLLGPLMGCLCGIATHFFLVAFHAWSLDWAYFLLCSLATGLIAGFFGRGNKPVSLYRGVVCMALVTLANAVIGAAIAAFAYGGITVHASDYLVTGLVLAGQSMLSASFWARIPLNLIDKGVAIGVAFFLYSRPGLRGFFGLSPLPAPHGAEA